ncbi:MAG TPA: tetratricopeptide repeat protein [Ramlibacter sp.]|uniref:tetratricopeptide repeat protein n=1 Tax=Ramlibacter sp. TaxID=1917967 RepID=UPI002B9AC71C|nr:tetratricopeptide repeat protein [Ramlibacter sp.]HVZ43327.1 tetratricopeptide repeat protein [Ramlibacter sp.]
MERSEAEALFQEAVALQESGRWTEAKPLYLAIVDAFPDYPHVGHLLGVIASQEGDQFLARRFIESSLAVNPQDADALANLAWTFVKLGEHAKALARSEEALRLAPDHLRAQLTRAFTLKLMQRHDEAVCAFDAILAREPRHVDALLFRGQSLHALARHEEALASYEAAIAVQPDHPELHNSRGVTFAVLERGDEAMASFRQALALQPRFPEALFNLGMQLQNLRQYEEALAHYEAALALRPDYPEALTYRAFALQRLRRMPHECVASLDRALALRPGYFEAINGRANVLGQLNQFAEALEDYDAAIAIKPSFHEAHLNRGHALRELGRLEEAAEAYREALRRGGDAQSGLFALAAMGQERAPGVAPPDYIVSLFDGYAERFDEHLVGKLKYQAHERVCEALLAFQPAPGDVLDLGCGTGLCAPLLKPVATSMTGVDLSPRMLEVAGRRGIYTRLECADVTAFLQGEPASGFDLVVSTDVFIYIGDLDPVFAGVRRCMREGGLFGFSIEASEREDFVLLATRRYAQSPGYIRRLAARHGFEELKLEPCTIRLERREQTPGYVVVLRAR